MYKPTFMPIPPGTSLAGKTVLVTGGNSGLGLEFAREVLTLNASHVVITVRSQAKGEAAIATLLADPEAQATNHDAKVEYFDLDLDDYESGLELVRKVYAEVPELDILLCNAGTNFFNYETSKSGHERLMQVIGYTHFLVVLSLLPLLRRTAAKRGSPTRVTFLSSYSHVRHTLESNPIAAEESVITHFDNVKKYVSGKRYQDSKLVINAFVQRLATIVPSSEVIVNCVCPGIVATDINQNLPLWVKPFMCVFFMIKARPVTEGGRVLVRAAVVVGEESHGKYLQTGEIHSGASFLGQPAGKQFIEKLWAEIVADIGKINPEVKVYA
ncbi:Short chain dehydrogenase sor7 [Penicillium cataractarum]|uniref:Short chain dehydrogenase sor7 n=1 Tax=Penicillium cataractarum TaxID=2100454 RepID=A0A9W9SMB7_9EURO|nr:Short chain dehydrogenase sor7 [Penicillium cataractarum]KAJ5380912.1 Short chain dehydrogenase sor7 [Penicillium cataractarum]